MRNQQRRTPHALRRWLWLALALGIAALFRPGAPASADGGDFSLDFTAAAPFTYNHETGGGAFNDRTVGNFNDIVESLEGGDFTCGDLVTFLTQIVVEQNVSDPVQTIEIDYRFLADTTGQSGVAYSDIWTVAVNYGQVENGDDGTGINPGAGQFGLDSGINDDGGSVATLTSESLTGPLYQQGSELLGTVQITDLEGAEEVVLRVDVRLSCQPGATNPTGNLQGAIDAARVTAPTPDTIPVGQQTIPLQLTSDPVGIGEPLLQIVKTVMPASGACGVDDFDQIVVTQGDPVVYCYQVSNPGTLPVFDLVITDDAATPGDPNDDFTITVAPLDNLDGEATADDLVAGGVAYGQSPPITYDIIDVYTNTACVAGNDDGGSDLDDCDPATVIVVEETAVRLSATGAAGTPAGIALALWLTLVAALALATTAAWHDNRRTG